MSYILEALNKSEQERRGSQTPDLNTLHRPPPVRSESSRPWLAALVIIVMLNAVAVIYWLSTRPAAENSTGNINNTTIAAETTHPQPEVQQTIQQSIQPSMQQRKEGASPAPTSITPQQVLITPTSIPAPVRETPVRITELPINVQRQVPNLVFSSHLYSDDAGFRMVNINGKMIREGDMVANDLKLLEITEGGVVLGYLHYVFEVSVLRDWSFN